MIERSFNMSYLKTPVPEVSRGSSLPHPAESPDPTIENPETVFDNIRQALQGLQFGEVTITVRNGTVVQIERVARKRQFKSNQREI